MTSSTAYEERAKYELVWAEQAYRRQADGDPLVDIAYEKMGCQAGESLIDWGCGTGRPALKFATKGLFVTGVDIAKNSLDRHVLPSIGFICQCIWEELTPQLQSDYAFCTDVLEHVPYNYLQLTVRNIAKATLKAAFFQVCVVPDSYGKTMNPPQTLHLSVMGPAVWRSLFHSFWDRVVQLENVGGKSRVCFVCFK